MRLILGRRHHLLLRKAFVSSFFQGLFDSLCLSLLSLSSLDSVQMFATCFSSYWLFNVVEKKSALNRWVARRF